MNIFSQIKNKSKPFIFKAGLNAIYYSGLHKLMAPSWQGMGAIFTLHQIGPDPKSDFAPYSLLTITPEFLESTIQSVLEQGLDIISLDEVHARLKAGKSENRFVSFTFDDGYRDNLIHAYPIFQKYKIPMTFYVPSEYPDGKGQLWWLALEKIIANNDQLTCEINGSRQTLRCTSINEKWACYNQLYRYCRNINEQQMLDLIAGMCATHGIDLAQLGKEQIMTWEEIRELSRDPLVTIGAHTRSHKAVAKLDADQAHEEIAEGINRLERELGRPVRHFSYPYGDAASAGPRDFDLASSFDLLTATTTRKGLLFKEHADHLMALPRVSLNGDYQSLHYNTTYLSGAPFALFNGFRKLNVA